MFSKTSFVSCVVVALGLVSAPAFGVAPRVDSDDIRDVVETGALVSRGRPALSGEAARGQDDKGAVEASLRNRKSRTVTSFEDVGEREGGGSLASRAAGASNVEAGPALRDRKGNGRFLGLDL